MGRVQGMQAAGRPAIGVSGTGRAQTSALDGEAPARPAIWTPWVDFLCVGGAAIVPLVVIFVLRVPFADFRYWNTAVPGSHAGA